MAVHDTIISNVKSNCKTLRTSGGWCAIYGEASETKQCMNSVCVCMHLFPYDGMAMDIFIEYALIVNATKRTKIISAPTE